MEKKTPSKTAERIAKHRTSESLRPEDERISVPIQNSEKGSRVIFDYYFLSAVDGTDQTEGAGYIGTFPGPAGEPLQFGIPGGGVRILANRIFSRIRDLNSGDSRNLYFSGNNADRKTTDLLSFAHAEVR